MDKAIELTLTAITMGFVNTTSTDTLMRMFQAGTLNLNNLITHGKHMNLSWLYARQALTWS